MPEKKMPRKLGRSGLEVSAMGLGCWAIGGPTWRGETPVGWGDIDDAQSTRAVRRALDLGVTFFDTADAYGAGHSERVLGEALGARRSEVVIATKFGNRYDEETRRLSGADASPDYIPTACDASLRRLGTDYIDLYQLHIGDLAMERVGEVLTALEKLVEAGKIRFYGWSTDDPARARAFAEGPHCTSVQFQMNVFTDAKAMVATCEELDLAGVNRGPLAMGLLSGKYDAQSVLPANDVRGTNAPGWMRLFREGRPAKEYLTMLDAVRDLLRSDGRTLVQGALAWLWARSDKLIPIPGFKNIGQVEENAGAMKYGPLPPEKMREIDRVLEPLRQART